MRTIVRLLIFFGSDVGITSVCIILFLIKKNTLDYTLF